MFIRQLEIYGSTGGSHDEFRQVITAFNRGAIRPVVDQVFALDQIDAAFETLARGQQFGKLLVKVA